MPAARDIKPGDMIVLRDGETIVSVTRKEFDAGDVLIWWNFAGGLRYMIYAPDEQIELAKSEEQP